MLEIQGKGLVGQGQVCVLGPLEEHGLEGIYTAPDPGLKWLRAGCFLQEQRPLFQVLEKSWAIGADGSGCLRIFLRAQEDVDLNRLLRLQSLRSGISLAWVTLSDKGAAGERADKSGPLIEEMACRSMSISLARGYVIPDDPQLLKALLIHLALVAGVDLILTTGGTGVGPRDITPDVTAEVVDKRLPGFERSMLAVSLQKTPHAAISRAVAGTLDESLIINLPGSPRAVRENLECVLPAIEHALAKLQGDPAECGSG